MVLDQATVLELIDQLRVAVPDEVRQARRITEEADRITERAREEGDAIVARAQEQAAQMLEERELVRAAQQRAAEILDQAQDEAREVRRGADEYAAGVLIRLEGECIKALTSIKRGIDMLDERHRPASDDGVDPAPTPATDRGRPGGAGPGRPPAVTSFNVAGLLHEPPGRDARASASATTHVALGPDVELAGPIDADLRLQRTNRGILLRGERPRAPCDGRAPAAPTRTSRRCVSPSTRSSCRASIRSPARPSRSTRRTGAACASTCTTRSSSTRSSTTSSSLTEPMHPLCRPDCPGLCAECGERLDDGDHAPWRDEIDPRLAGLAALLRRRRRRGAMMAERGSPSQPLDPAILRRPRFTSVKEFPRGRSQAKGFQGAPG